MNVAKAALALRMLADALEDNANETDHEKLVSAARGLSSVRDALHKGYKIAAIKYLREYAKANALPWGLRECKDAIDTLCDDPTMGYPGYRPMI